MASGKASGICTGSSASKYNFWIEWISVATASTNSSKVTAYAYLQRNDGYSASAYNLDLSANSKNLSIAGTTYHSTKTGIDTRNSVKVLVCSASKTVSHNSSGVAKINISSTLPQISGSLTGGTVSKTVELDIIDNKSPVIKSFSVSTTQTTAVFSWTVDSTCDVQKYSLNGGSTWSILPANKTITGLTANTKYNFKLYLRKKSNEKTATSATVTKSTLPYLATAISINNVSVNVGSTVTLNPVFTPTNVSDKTIKYTQNDEYYTISNNVLTAKKIGIFTIRATSVSNSSVYCDFVVTIGASVTGITVSSTEYVVKVLGSVDVNYTVLPQNASNKNVIIESDNTSVATVNQTTITGVSEGKANVVITTVDGGFSQNIVVTVTSDINYHDYSAVPDILNYFDVNNFNENMKIIRTLALGKSLTVGNLNTVVARMSTQLVDIFDILQKTEYNLDILQDVPELFSIYYNAPYSIVRTAWGKPELQRLIQTTNDMFLIVSGQIQKWQTLVCTNGKPTINGDYLIVRGEYIE